MALTCKQAYASPNVHETRQFQFSETRSETAKSHSQKRNIPKSDHDTCSPTWKPPTPGHDKNHTGIGSKLSLGKFKTKFSAMYSAHSQGQRLQMRLMMASISGSTASSP